MAQEIERKFLVTNDRWKGIVPRVFYRQGYLSTVKERTVRVRTFADTAFLTIKGVSVGISRLEYEYEIPVDDANRLLSELCEKPILEKYRSKIKYGNLVWEIDEFEGANRGLVIAEVELDSVDQVIDLPEWVGIEVSHDPRYFNSSLAKVPFTDWR